MATYLKSFLNDPAPQSEALDERQVANSAGGYSYPVDDMERLRRFMILGSEGGSYYASERDLTRENVGSVKRLIQEDGRTAVDQIVRISSSRRAPKNGPALFAMAMAASHGNDETRRLALSFLPTVARTGSHLLEFMSYAHSMRGWGRGLRKALELWYTEKACSDVVYQVVKYRNRYDWTHRDVLRIAHPKAESEFHHALFKYVTSGVLDPNVDTKEDLAFAHAFEEAKTASIGELPQLIERHNLTWEMVPAEALSENRVWDTLGHQMPITALVRNLATLTRAESITPMKSEWAVEKLDKIGVSAKLHPVAVLAALLTYKAGESARGQNEWTPVPQIVDALDRAFVKAFDIVEPSNKGIYLAVDVSDSMNWSTVAGVPGLSPKVGAAAMAMAVARTEPNYYVAGFSHEMADLGITAADSLAAVCDRIDAMPMGGGTDCALPMLDALKRKMAVDCFVVLTDSETWYGSIHPAEALRLYRGVTGIPAKLVVVGMVSNEFSIADPEDGGMMDVMGFDTAVPQVIADFIRGEE